MDWSIVGHKRQLDFLAKTMQNGKLAHGFLFAGPSGVGKKSVGRELAQALLGKKGGENFFDPDFLEVDGSNGIKIEQIRELAYKLSLMPYAGKFKIALVDHAEQMSIEAANALLKVLEEPKPHTIIILITPNPNRLPKTIVSRTQKISFGLVEFKEYESILPKKLTKEQKELIRVLADGRPGLALQISSDENFLEELNEIEHAFQTFASTNTVDRLILASEIAAWETSKIKILLETWLSHLTFNLEADPSIMLKRKIDQVMLAGKYLSQNANSKLLLTNLMLNT